MSGFDLTILADGGFVAIASDRQAAREMCQAVFDSPDGRRIKLRDWQAILRRRRRELVECRVSGDIGWRRELLADLRRARAGVKRAKAMVVAIPADFPGRTR